MGDHRRHPPGRGRGRSLGRTAVDVLGAAAAALVVFLAVPAVLVLVVGNPVHGGLGHAWPAVSRDALCAVVLAAWVAWAACSAQLVRAVAAHVRRGATTAADASVFDRLAARIALGILAMSSVSVASPALLAPAAGASAPVAAAAGRSALGPEAAAPNRLSDAGQRHRAGPDAAASDVHTVREGDSLGTIARERLGDEADWAAIAALNLGATMADRTRFVDPDHLRAGWRLRLPGGASETSRDAPAVAAGSRLDARLPELAALGAGSLTCAALARRARRRRQQAGLVADPDLPTLGPRHQALSARAVDAAALLGRFDGVPSLGLFEAANVMLARAVGRDPARHPSVRMICVGPAGVTFWLRLPAPGAPPGFEPMHDGAAWHVDHRLLDDAGPGQPYVPVALPVGDDDHGTWLLALEPGDVVPLLGSSATALWRAARAAQESWAWADEVVVTERADDPRLALPLSADPVTARRIVFFGHPDALPPAPAHDASIVTTDPVAASDLSILVDQHAATIHPTGRVVRPHLMTAAVREDVEEVVAGTRLGAAGAPARAVPSSAGPHRAAALPPSTDDPLGIDAGTVDVRLLTMTPRLDGLCEDLPPNRARRAIELVAYLALHHPDVITGDRLRTRVLGSADADAAAKTLFNTAHAARRAMGLDESGDPLFPAGSRTGLYQVSSAVTVDVQRAAEMVRLAKASDEHDVAIAFYRGALDLVEGEPLANALSGYTWWEAEGHAGRIAAVLADAACSLVPLCVDRHLFDLARWGLDRARVVAPYSEALARAAMELAAAEGDADRLRTEWRECQRMVDALDPGASPSRRTETLYGELSRRLLVPAGRQPGVVAQPWGAASPASERTPAATP